MNTTQFACHRRTSAVALAALVFTSLGVQADTWRTEFQGTVYEVDAALMPTFQVGQAVTGSFTYKGTPAVAPNSGVVAYPMTALEVAFPGYSLAGSASGPPYVGGVSFHNDIDYGHPLVDVDDIYIVSAGSFVSAPPVSGLSAGNFVIRLESRGTPPINMFQDGQVMYAPPSLANATTLNYAYIQFTGFQEVFLRITSIQVTEILSDDTDQDGIPDTTDNCVNTLNSDQTDTDLDGQGDACDLDNDNDGIADTSDNCKFSPNPDQADLDGDGLGNVCDSDPDGDSVVGAADNCPLVPNTDQTNTDGDGSGDDCDTDDDNDSVCDIDADAPGCAAGPDNCPTIHNTDQQDVEGDGIGDACDADLDNDGIGNASDNCPVDGNVDQNDVDGDGQGDVCDSDIDNDTIANAGDNCPNLANTAQDDQDQDGTGDACDADIDGDGIATTGDNCPLIANSDQMNFDGDSSGDACDTDVDGDSVANGTDQCGLTPLGTTVDPQNGCALVQLCPCSGPAGTTVPWKNHGKYVSCVAHVAGDFAASGLITAAQKDALVSAAGQSTCGR